MFLVLFLPRSGGGGGDGGVCVCACVCVEWDEHNTNHAEGNLHRDGECTIALVIAQLHLPVFLRVDVLVQ